MITTQDLVPKHILELPRVHEQAPHRLQRVQDWEQEQEENENERHEHDQQKRHSLHLRERDLYVRRLYRAITTVRFHVSDVSIFLRVRPCRLRQITKQYGSPASPSLAPPTYGLPVPC